MGPLMRAMLPSWFVGENSDWDIAKYKIVPGIASFLLDDLFVAKGNKNRTTAIHYCEDIISQVIRPNILTMKLDQKYKKLVEPVPQGLCDALMGDKSYTWDKFLSNNKPWKDLMNDQTIKSAVKDFLATNAPTDFRTWAEDILPGPYAQVQMAAPCPTGRHGISTTRSIMDVRRTIIEFMSIANRTVVRDVAKAVFGGSMPET